MTKYIYIYIKKIYRVNFNKTIYAYIFFIFESNPSK